MAPLHILKDLPREVRDKIYLETICSSQNMCLNAIKDMGGEIVFFGLRAIKADENDHTNDGYQDLGAINLSFLRTCRQIYAECSEYIWKYNTLVLQPGELSKRIVHQRAFRRILKVQHVRFSLVRNDPHLLHDTKVIVQCLRYWSRNGNLKEVTFTIKPTFDPLLYGKPIGYMIQDAGLFMILNNTFLDGGPLSHITRKVVISGKDIPRIEASDIKNISSFAGAIHYFLEGEVWFEGKLCYKSQQKLAELFPSDGGLWLRNDCLLSSSRKL